MDFTIKEETNEIEAVCTARTTGKTGVEMEALTGVNIALLTIYDMCKAVDKSMEMGIFTWSINPAEKAVSCQPEKAGMLMKDRMEERSTMRFSITDRCNLRCKYCMPDGIDCMPRWDVLALEEFEAIAIAAASWELKRSVTGGETIGKKKLPQLVKMLKKYTWHRKGNADYQRSPVSAVSGPAVRCRTGCS